MKRFSILLFAIFAAVLASNVYAAKNKVVDFNYPVKVSKDAFSDLKRGLRLSDGEQVVDALVRYSLAQSMIDEDNIDNIMRGIDALIEREKQPHIKALLYLLQIRILDGYEGSPIEPVADTYPDSYTAYGVGMLMKKQKELLYKILDYREDLLKVPVTSMPKIICVTPMGALYVPTLYQFVLSQIDELRLWSFFDKQKEDIEDKWLASVEGNIPAEIYAISMLSACDDELYKKYNTNEHSGLLLSCYVRNDSARLAMCNDYLERFPNGVYSTDVRNIANNICNIGVHVVSPNQVMRREPIKGKVAFSNTSRCVLELWGTEKHPLPGGLYRYEKKLIETTDVVADTTGMNYPYKVEKEYEFSGQDYGSYRLAMKFYKNGEEIVDTVSCTSDIVVTDLSAMVYSQKAITKAFALNARTGAPVEGATITVRKLPGNEYFTVTTGADGGAAIDASISHGDVTPSRGEDVKARPASFDAITQWGDVNSNNVYCNVFTDLAIYRPGETVNWALVMHDCINGKRGVVPGKRVTVSLRNELKGEVVAKSEVLTTDSTGRVQGTFAMPTDMVNGTYYIVAFLDEGTAQEDDAEAIGYKEVLMSEYKASTYELSLDSVPGRFAQGESIVGTCKVTSYSGMPIGKAQILWTLYHCPFIGRLSVNNYDMKGMNYVYTDDNGIARIEIPAEALAGKDNAQRGHGMYLLNVDCVSPNGEMQTCNKQIVVGSAQNISMPKDPIVCNAVEPFRVPVTYFSTEKDDTTAMVAYDLVDVVTRKVVKSGTLQSHNPVISIKDVQSGVYQFKAYIAQADTTDGGTRAVADVTVYRPTDKIAPVKNVPLWSPVKEVKTDSYGLAHVVVANSVPESHVYCVVEAGDSIVSAQWRTLPQGMYSIDVQVPDGESGCKLVMISMHDNKFYSHIVKVSCEERVPQFSIATSVFRDKLVPGSTERWTLRLTGKDGRQAPGFMLLEMVDKAVDKLRANRFGLTRPISASVWGLYTHHFDKMEYFGNLKYAYNSPVINFAPQLYLYGQTFFDVPDDVEERCYTDAPRKPSKPYSIFYSWLSQNDDLNRALEGRVAGVQVNSSGSFGTAPKIRVRGATSVYGFRSPEIDLDVVKLRDNIVKTALWRPMLVSDSDGNIDVEFTVPEGNTTWMVQALAYNRNMLSDTLLRYVVTQRPIMVKPQLPRYVRSGDVANLTAEVMNATGDAVDVSAVVELFDPRTGRVYTTQPYNGSLASHGTQAVTVRWTVPDNVPFVGFRVKAAGNGNSDGEQVMLPVLPCVQPVTEAAQFIVHKDCNEATVTVPGASGNARVAIEYCSNPLLAVYSALPSIYNDSPSTSTQLAHSLFAIDVARGVNEKYGLGAVKVDTTSVWARNAGLRMGTIKATPWIGDSTRMSARMAALARLNDTTAMNIERKKLVDKLLNLQCADGGFSWFKCPSARSSFYGTNVVLEIVGEIKHNGMLPDDKRLDKALARAMAYCDSINVANFNALKDKSSYRGFSTWVFLHSLFPELHMDKNVNNLHDKALKSMSKWEKQGLTLVDKAYWAMALNRNGKHKEALQLTRSIKEFAVTSPMLGTFWNSVDDGWRGYDKVAVTAVIMQAINEVEGPCAEVEGARRWMLMMKQSNDWGSGSLAADAVYSLLSTAGKDDFTLSPCKIQVSIDGKPLDAAFDEMGSMNIDAAPGASITVGSNNRGLAWGAVYSQYSGDMASLSAVSTPELGITKEYLVYDSGNNLVHRDSFAVGDHVQVRITVTSKRDLDYVVLSDERASCLEPVDQISGYRYSGGLWQFLETKDSSTNVYITHLDKGTHVITYDAYATIPGTYAAGTAAVQCQLAPQASAHTAGATIMVAARE